MSKPPMKRLLLRDADAERLGVKRCHCGAYPRLWRLTMFAFECCDRQSRAGGELEQAIANWNRIACPEEIEV